ncbi:hypothetical protein [Aeromonas sp. Y311-2]|uniref:hypothetical protein n=1 Tax=Aeromonas sp. Y311-2 TaxID=2990507 RepID=UPI0022DED23A|nr:hypothetical protein [Aeromonas sp. Y311-2]
MSHTEHLLALLKEAAEVAPPELKERIEAAIGESAPGMFYLQDARGYSGNCISWWRAGGGYTTSLAEAELFTRERACYHNQDRETDIPWPAEYVRARADMTVDMQRVTISEALEGTGIKLHKPDRPIRQPNKCFTCGKFYGARHYYDCPHCGASNAP